MTLARFLNGDEARKRHGAPLVDRLERGLNEVDELGGAIVATFADLPSGAGARMLNAWLDGAEPPDPRLTELFAQLAVVPDWVDWDAIERAAIAYWRGGNWTALALNCAALAAGYYSGAGVKPLMFTGRLIHMARRRQQETARWLLAASAPGGMRRDAPGFKETVRVRIVHANVRRRLASSVRWRAQDWGAPINLTDVAWGIAGEFSTTPVRAVRDAGIHYASAEREDIQHMWRYIGHVLGLPEDLQAKSEAEALEMMAIKHLVDTPADDDSRQLIRALIENGTPPRLLFPAWVAYTAGPLIKPTLYSLTRRWAGKKTADELGLPDTPLKYIVGITRPFVMAAELARRMGLRDDAAMAASTLARLQLILEKSNAPGHVVDVDEAARSV